MFACTVCGRSTPAPGPCTKGALDNVPEWHVNKGLTCEEVEAKMRAEAEAHPLLLAAVVRADTFARRAYGKTVSNVARQIRADRAAILDTVINVALKAVDAQASERYWRVWQAIHSVREEIVKK